MSYVLTKYEVSNLLIFQFTILTYESEESGGPPLALYMLLNILALVPISYECYAVKNKIPFDHDDKDCECDECPNYREGYETI